MIDSPIPLPIPTPDALPPPSDDLLVRVVAPSGRDGSLITSVLRADGILAKLCPDPLAFLAEIDPASLGPMLIAEEALTIALFDRLATIAREQPTWSDLPLLLLTGTGSETRQSRSTARKWLPLGDPVLLERPLRSTTLLASVRAALRARAKQYDIRGALAERDRALATLSRERESLQVMLDNLPVGVLMADAKGEITRSNRAVEHIFRHPAIPSPDIESHGSWVSYHPDGRRVRGAEYPLARAILTGRHVPAEIFHYERGDGTRAWVSIAAAPIFDEHDAVTGGVVAIADVDREQRALDDLRTSDERFRLLLENSTVGVLIGDTVGGISYLNSTMRETLGYSLAEVKAGAVRWDRLTPPEYAVADQHALEQLIATGSAAPYEKSYLSRDGRPIPFLIGATILPSTHGHAEVAVFCTDLSHQKQAETALIRSEKLAAVGRLAASISHEINNPLEAITNLLYLLKQETLPSQALTYLLLAEQELARVSQIAAQTLRFHRQSTRARPVTPRDLLDPVLGLYLGRLNNSGISVRFTDRDTPPFLCFEGDIRQVLNNLVSNAIDSMRTGGRLLIRSRAAHCPRTGNPGVRITVADTGHGMSPAVAQRIFEAFYTTKGINGTGLGLWISAGIVEKHHGKLRARSSSGERAHGTVFSLFLPHDLQPIASSQAAMNIVEPNLPPEQPDIVSGP